jgi:hypothetical protein
MATLVCADALSSEVIDVVTDLPRGARVCLRCDVSWSPMGSLACWFCGRPGVTSATAHAMRAPAEATAETRADL